jgi:CheY-like chemotaxis protein
MSILTVGNEPDRRNALQTMLTAAYLTNVAAAGAIGEVLRMVESGGIHLALTDLMAHSMKALELCRRIRDGKRKTYQSLR